MCVRARVWPGSSGGSSRVPAAAAERNCSLALCQEGRTCPVLIAHLRSSLAPHAVISTCAEHSLCWKLKQSPQLGSLYCLPGNAGIAAVAECVGGIGVADVPKVRPAGVRCPRLLREQPLCGRDRCGSQ